jgi:hypothetical protein
MPHNTAAAASATGTPEPIEGAGAGSVGIAWATVAALTKTPMANVSNFISIPTRPLSFT